MNPPADFWDRVASELAALLVKQMGLPFQMPKAGDLKAPPFPAGDPLAALINAVSAVRVPADQTAAGSPRCETAQTLVVGQNFVQPYR